MQRSTSDTPPHTRACARNNTTQVRNALGGGPACFRNLRHQFLTVLARNSDGSSSSLVLPPPQQQQQQAGSMMVSAGGLGVDANSTSASAGRAALLPAAAAMAPASSMQYVVDPHFKQQFEVSQPSAAYAAALELVPPEFVGTCSRLVPLVHALCAEMAASFEAMGLTLPPWRRASAMLSKWQPSRCHDVCVSASGCGANGECAAAAASGSSGSSTPAGSPTGADAAAAEGSSPFSRIDDCQILLRQGSGRSLLSGKLNGGGGGPAGSSMSGTSSSAACVGAGGGAAAARTHSVPCFSRTSSGCSCASITSMQGTSSDLHLQQRRQQAAQLAAAAQQHVTGTVSRQPPVYRGLPATYTVKRGGPAYTPQPPQ
jgi:uncharacterized protein (TIGR01615 family)